MSSWSGKIRDGAAGRREGVAPAACSGVEPAELAKRPDLDLVAAPGYRQRLEPRDPLIGLHRALGERERHPAQGGFGCDRALRRLGEPAVEIEGDVVPPLGLGDAALEERDLVPLDRLRSEPAGSYGLRPREIDILRLDCGPRHRDAQSHLDIVGIGIDRRLRAPEGCERRRPSLRPCVEHRTPEHRLRIFRDEVGRKHAPGFRCAVRARERNGLEEQELPLPRERRIV